MAWGAVNVDEQRMQFVVLASRREKTMQELCREFQISRPTGYQWLQRFQAGGTRAVAEKSRRPHRSPRRTGARIEQRVVELRKQRPDWGARKLRVLLQQERIDVPVITIHRILLRHDLVRPADRQEIAVQRFERGAANQLWQMDFKSPVPWEESAGPLSLLDDHSRYAVDLHGTWCTRAEPVKERLEHAFQHCGVPEEMLMDHGTPWWNMKAISGWTWLTVWLMKQGIRLHFSGFGHPQTQGKVERFHGTLSAAMKRRPLPRGEERQRWLDEFRYEYNHVRPHEALGMKTPASVWKPSERRYQANPPQWEYQRGSEVRKLTPQGRVSFHSRSWEISRALAGEWVQLVRIGERVLVYYCRSLLRELDLLTQRSTAMHHWAPPAVECKGCPDNAV
jgi:transposase InsO family protein